MRKGVITNDQFVRVIDEMTRAAAGNNPLRFGEVAVSLGVLSPEQVENGLAEQVCGIITRSLQRGESQWAFEAAPAAAKPPRSFSLAINAAVLAALRQSSDRSAVADVVAARPDELVIVAGPAGRPSTADARDEAGGAAVETHAARMAAEQAFQKGLALLRETKTASAAIELRRASELQPESLEYQLYAIWARARSYREVPTESDQQLLLDIAHKAKKRDPMFAFGSYVIGQLAMWADDDATAKKWFYEALRLDPASEAGKQVRILARRAAGAAPAPGAEAQPGDDAAPVPAPEPPVQVVAAVPPARAPSRPRGKRGKRGVAVAVLIVATGAFVILAVAREAGLRKGRSGRAPRPRRRSRAMLHRLPDRKARTRPGRRRAPSIASGDAEQDDAEMGTVLLPPRAAGHRIFVDGRRAKTDGARAAPAPLWRARRPDRKRRDGRDHRRPLPRRGSVTIGAAPGMSPSSKPAADPAPPKRFGIDRAIQLMRALPTEQNPELVAMVITTTLESLELSVTDIISDAKTRQAELEARIGSIKAKNSALEKEIEIGVEEIVKLEATLAETVNVKERLEHAHDHQATHKLSGS